MPIPRFASESDQERYYDPDEHPKEVYEYFNTITNWSGTLKDFMQESSVGPDSFIAYAEEDENYINDCEKGIVEDAFEWVEKDPGGHATQLWNRIKPNYNTYYTFLEKGNELDYFFKLWRDAVYDADFWYEGDEW